VLEPIERQMLGELGDDHLSEQARSSITTAHRALGNIRSDHAKDEAAIEL
jgi:hypothetical protein